MTATQRPIPSHQPPNPLATPPKPAYLSNGTTDSPPPLHKRSNETKRAPLLPTKPKPLLDQRISRSSNRLNQTDSSPDDSPRPRIKAVPFTKKYSLESVLPVSTTYVALPFHHPPLCPTRSTSHIPAPPSQALKPRASTPTSSSPTHRRCSTESDVNKRSPVIARKPLFHNKSAVSVSTYSIFNNDAFFTNTSPLLTNKVSNSEDSGVSVCPEKTLPDIPPQLPAKPEKSMSNNTIGNTNKIIIVPRIAPMQQNWSTNISNIPLPPLPTGPTESVEGRSKGLSESGEKDMKLHRTLPSRGTKKKKRPVLLNHMNGTYSQPSTPPPVHKAPVVERKSNELSPFTAQMALNLSHSFDSLDSMDSEGSTELSSRKSQQLEVSRKKNARLSGNLPHEEKRGKMRFPKALKKALGVGRKERSLDQDPSSSLSTSISSPSLVVDNPNLLSVQSVPAKISLALNAHERTMDDLCVFENLSENELDSEPIPLTKISCDPDKSPNPSAFSPNTSPAKKPKNSKPTDKRSFTQLDSTPSSPNHIYPYPDFQYVYENTESDSDSHSDVGAFDEYDDSDNEMTEEQVNQVKIWTLARAKSGVTFSKCYYVAKEMLSTEETYVRKLRLVNVEFPEALEEASKKSGKTLLPEETFKKIFSNLPVLYNINSIFRDDLKERLDKWTRLDTSTQKIGDIMRKHAHFFKIYSPFISNFDNALKLIDEHIKKNSSFASFLTSFQSLPKCCSFPLSAHMLAIVQRIPRYKLLLEQYIKHLPEDSEDQEDSVKALEIISEVAQHVNENLRSIENFNKMIEVLNKIEGDTSNMLAPSRQFIKQGELRKVCRKGLQVRAFFLFTDMLLHTSPPGPGSSTYSLHTRIPLAGMKVSDLEQAEDLSEADPLKHGFKIISAIRSFVVVSASHEEKEEWLTILTKTLGDLQNKIVSHAKTNNRTSIFVDTSLLDTSDIPLGSLAPVWIPDDSVSMCMMCYNKFTFARRRHHCRVCGKVLCGPCSNFKIEIKYLDKKQARCCLNCYESLTDSRQRECGISTTDEPDQSQAGLTEAPENENKRNKRTRLRKERSLMPAHLIQVSASEVEYQMRGNLEYSETSSSKFRHSRWVLLQGNVLYLYKKREDAAAVLAVPIPGYKVEGITETVFVLRHLNVQDKFFKAESKELAEKWRKELSRVLTDTVTDVTPDKSLEMEKPTLLRTRSATTSQLDEKESYFDDEESDRSTSVKNPIKYYSTGGVPISCKLSDPTSPIDSDTKDVVESEVAEELTQTLKEDTPIESTD